MYYQILDQLKERFWVFTFVATSIALGANYLGSIDLSYLILFIGFLIGALLVFVIFFNPLYAIVINWACSYVLSFLVFIVLKISSVPIGLVFEGLNFLGLFILLFRRELLGGNTQIGKFLLLWFFICCVELVNPFSASRVAWLFAIRQLLFILIPFFLIYSLFLTNKNSFKFLFFTWLFFSTLAALYTLYQEFFGVPLFQYNTFAHDEKVMSLLMTFGRLRKMAFFPGPMDNGMVLALNSVMCLGLAFQEGLKRKYQILYLIVCLLSTWSMIYTGTRTATVLFVFGLFVYILLSRKKELILMSVACAILLIGYIAVTGGGQALFVMTTAFNPEEDPSMMVRYNNQLLLRDYLYRSPIGYGLGSTGFIGNRFTPYTFLGAFPPDSELVRIVIETGFLGLGVYLYLMFYFIKSGLNRLFEDTGDFSNNFKKIIISLLFMMLVGQYPQEILNVLPLKILFAFMLAYISLSKEQLRKLHGLI